MDIAKLAERLAKLQEKKSAGNRKNNLLKLTEEKQKIRIVPYPHNPVGPFIEAWFHYNVAGNRSLVCPRGTFKEPCPICELADEFYAMGTKDSWAMFKKIQHKLRTFSPVIVRGKEEDGVKLWGYGSTTFETIMEKCLDPDWGDISDPKSGRDLTVWSVPVGKSGNDTEYAQPKMDVSPNVTPLLAKKSDIIKLLEDIPNYLNDGETFPVRSYQELKDIVRKMSDVEDDDESEAEDASSEEEARGEAPPPVTDDDDLNDRLNKLLGK